MAASKRYSVEQIIAKLRKAEKFQAQGLTIPQARRRLQISDQTFYRWRLKYGALKEDEAGGLRPTNFWLNFCPREPIRPDPR